MRKYTGVMQYFHNFEHDSQGLNHCHSEGNYPYTIKHADGKHVISSPVAIGHGRDAKQQGFRFTKRLAGGYDMSSGVKVDIKRGDNMGVLDTALQTTAATIPIAITAGVAQSFTRKPKAVAKPRRKTAKPKRGEKTMTSNKAQVFLVPGSETGSGKHVVRYAADGNLNKGKTKSYPATDRGWQQAEGFAHRKGKELKANTRIHAYRLNPTYSTNYSQKEKAGGQKKGIHAAERSGLRPLKKGEKVVYYGGAFHIEKIVYKGKGVTITEREDKTRSRAQKGRTPKAKTDKGDLGAGVFQDRGRRHVRLG